jgi:hypothetical protein
VPSIGLAAGARIAQALASHWRCKMAEGTVHNVSQPIPAEHLPGTLTDRRHIYLAQGTKIEVVARARRTPQSPPLRYTSTAILANCQRAKISVLCILTRIEAGRGRCVVRRPR